MFIRYESNRIFITYETFGEMSKQMSDIKLFKEFLEEQLGAKVLEYCLKPLTKPGENFGAELRTAEVKVINNSNEVN